MVQYINKLFPTEQSLAGLDEMMSDLNCQVVSIEDNIREMVRNQTAEGGDPAAALEEAQSAIIQLFSQIRDIKNKAGESESMVKEITRDIKQLDTAMKNLTSAITTQNHLHMLVRGMATLTQNTHSRQYGEAALLLQELLEVLSHFKNYQNIPQIKELSDQVESLKRELGDQIIKDFEVRMTGDNSAAAGGSKQLAENLLSGLSVGAEGEEEPGVLVHTVADEGVHHPVHHRGGQRLAGQVGQTVHSYITEGSPSLPPTSLSTKHISH